MNGMRMRPKVSAIQPAQRAIQATGRRRKSWKASAIQAAPREARSSVTLMLASMVSRLRERVLKTVRVSNVMLEEPTRELVVLGDLHVRVARKMVIAQTSEPGPERCASKHHRPELSLKVGKRPLPLVACDEVVG